MEGKVTYIYRVAEQVFSLRGEERLLIAASNLAPFRIASDDKAERLFSIDLKTVKSFGEVTGWEHFFTDNSEPDMPRIEVYRSEGIGFPTSNAQQGVGNWLFRIAQVADSPTCCEVKMTKDFSQAWVQVLEDAHPAMLRFAIDNAAMLLFAFATSHRHILEMHASVVVHEGKARLFLGHSGTGKSTHARQWLALYHTAYLLNDDNPILRVDDEGKTWVYGSPWSGKTPCYRNERVPVAGIVQLQQAPKNEISTLPPSQAYAYMLSSCSGLKVLHEAMDGIHETISAIVLSVPMLKLRCLPDKAAAELCYNATT